MVFLRSNGPVARDDLFNALKLFPSCLQLPLLQRPLNSRPFVARRVVERSNKGWIWFTQLVSGHTSGCGSIHGSVPCVSYTGLQMKHDGVRLFGAFYRSRARRCSARLRYQSDRSRRWCQRDPSRASGTSIGCTSIVLMSKCTNTFQTQLPSLALAGAGHAPEYHLTMREQSTTKKPVSRDSRKIGEASVQRQRSQQMAARCVRGFEMALCNSCWNG